MLSSEICFFFVYKIQTFFTLFFGYRYSERSKLLKKKKRTSKKKITKISGQCRLHIHRLTCDWLNMAVLTERPPASFTPHVCGLLYKLSGCAAAPTGEELNEPHGYQCSTATAFRLGLLLQETLRSLPSAGRSSPQSRTFLH